MAKDVITRFKLETTQYDSKIKNAAKELSDVAKAAKSAGADFERFTKDSLDAAKALGNISTSSTNAKDRAKELVGAFNDVARSYNQLTKEQQQSDFGKAMAQSLTQLQQRIRETKQEMQGLSGKEGGLFGDNGVSGMLQVFGGNLMTKAAGMVAGLGVEVVACMNESAELAKQAEGVQIAFARLGRGDILDGLREATHGTVSDLELMKASVKFNDFRLPVEELGTMLAFAQQKAKDTGQSVDYMVDSIVTGLGRKSLMILDNLGLSAAEIKEKMKETGDMTKAVGEIIREQMAKAGDYVETAADRAAQANVELQNAMLELGSTMREVFGYNGWDEMATGIKTELVGAITFTIETIGKAKEALKDFVDFWGNFFGRKSLKGDNQKPPKQTPKDGTYYEETDSDGNLLTTGYYMNGKKKINGYGFTVTGHQPTEEEKKKRKQIGVFGGKGGKTDIQFAEDSIMAQEKLVQKLTQDWKTASAAVKDDYKKQLDEAQVTLNKMLGKVPEPVVPGSLKAYQEQLKESQSDLQFMREDLLRLKEVGAEPMEIAVKEDEIQDAIDNISTIEKKIDELNGKSANISINIGEEAGSFDIGESMMEKLRDEIAASAENADMSTITEFIKQGIENGVDSADMTSIGQKLIQRMTNGDDIDPSDMEDFLATMKEKLQGIIDEKEWPAIEIAVKTGDLTAIQEFTKRVQVASKTAEDGWKHAASAISTLGSALNQIEDPMAKVIGTIAMAVAQVAEAAGKAINAPDTTSSGWAWIGAATAITATMVSTIATIHSATKFADGGIVPGSTMSGDQIPALLNAQEVVLNHAQVGNLAAQLEGGSSQGGQPNVRIEGEDLWITLNNYTQRSGYGEIVTSK